MIVVIREEHLLEARDIMRPYGPLSYDLIRHKGVTYAVISHGAAAGLILIQLQLGINLEEV